MDPVLRPATAEDTTFLAELFTEVNAPQFAPLGLPPEALRQLLDMQFHAQVAGYTSQFPAAEDTVVMLGGERAGRLLVDRSQKEMQLIDMALLARFRGHGCGTSLVQRLCDEAGTSGKSITLFVRFDNPAERLYARMGFVRTGGDGLNSAMQWKPGAREARSEVQPAFPADDCPLVQEFASRYFRSWIGKQIEARGYEGTTVSLRMEELVILPSLYNTDERVEDNFVLRFHGPLQPVLPSATAAVTCAGAEPMEIFLVPLGPRDGAMQYEAVFNNWRART